MSAVFSIVMSAILGQFLTLTLLGIADVLNEHPHRAIIVLHRAMNSYLKKSFHANFATIGLQTISLTPQGFQFCAQI